MSLLTSNCLVKNFNVLVIFLTLTAPVASFSADPPKGNVTHGVRFDDFRPPIPEKYRDLRNPLKRDENNLNNLNRGEWLYDINCSPCHGGNLDGNGPEAAGLFPPPANLLHLVSTIKPPESYLFWRIKEGGPGLPMHWRPWDSAMPVWKYELTDDEIWQIILYIYEATGESPP